MTGFSVDGLVSGLDTTALVRQLMQLEAIPQQRLKTSATQQTTDIKALQSLATSLKKLDDAAAALDLAETWTGAKATVTGDAVTVAARGAATAGSYDLEVSQLATARSWTSTGPLGLDDPVASGPLDITQADGTVVSLDTGSGSLKDVVAAINGAEGLGVTATAVRVSDSSYRLQIVAEQTGASTGSLAVSGLTTPTDDVPGQDALYTINGIEGRSSSNTVTDLVSGVDVTFVKTGDAKVSLAQDRTATASAVEKLVTAANDALAEVRKHTVNDPDLPRGALASDNMVRALSDRILRAVTATAGGANAGIGIQSSKDGTLVLDKDVLTAALAEDSNAVRAVLAPSTGAGITSRLREVVDSATDTSDGFITSSIQGRESRKKDLETQISSWDFRLEQRQATLQRQFSGLEVALQRLQSQSQYLAGQLGSLSSGSS